MSDISAPSNSAHRDAIQPRLGLWDAVSIIIGIVVGTAIFRTPAMVFANVGSPAAAMMLWLVGGALAWCGAVCYAELATTYPRDGGDYEYLNRAFGPWCGFLFSWAQLTTVISGNIAIMAYAFADYAIRLWPALKNQSVWLTIAPVIVLSALNGLGVVAGKSAQNVLTTGKIFGLLALVIVGLAIGAKPQVADRPWRAPADLDGSSSGNIGLALVFVLYAYGGWNHTAYVAAEVRDQARNLPRALMLGILGVAIIYIAVNGAYLSVLGFDGVKQSLTPAAEVLERAWGAVGGRAMSLLVILSALGAINGMVLTGTRIYAVWGADYRALSWLGTWDRRVAAPIAAIVAQAVVAVLLIVLVGTEHGRNLFDDALGAIGVDALAWNNFAGGFEMLVAGSAPVYWGLCLLTGIAVFVLRAKDRAIRRPFRMHLYPLPAIVFCLTCAYMLRASLVYARWLTLLGVVPLALGGVVWLVVRHTSVRSENPSAS